MIRLRRIRGQRRITKQLTNDRVLYYIQDDAGKVVAYGILSKGLQVETGHPELVSSVNPALFGQIFSSWSFDQGDIIGVLKPELEPIK